MQNIINLISNNLEYRNGIWYSNINTIISYPKEGNDSCFEIEDNSFWFKHRNDCILELVQRFVNKQVLVDIGGGNGFTCSHLEKNNIKTLLIEPGDGIYNAQKRGLTLLVCSDFNDEFFVNNKIPNIGLFDVLEHIENDSAFLQVVFNKLESQGRVFITVPAYSFLWSNDDVEAGHYRRYTLKSLKKLLQDIGFKIEYESYFFSILIFPIFMFRSLPSLFTKKRKSINKIKNEHSMKNSKSLLEKIWQFELNQIKKNKKIFFGSSCIIVATKNKL